MQTIFPSLADLSIIYRLQKERGDRYFPLIRYKRLILVNSEINDIHHEIDESDKQFEDPIDIRAYVVPDAETHPLNEFGIEEKRNLTMHITVPHLLEAGFVEQDEATGNVRRICKIGDRFEFSGVEYNVLDITRGKRFANTDIPIDFIFISERYREEASEFDLVRFE